MARVPGTETQINLAGWSPGTEARCRRSRANASRDLADRRGLIVEVRPHHVRLLLEPDPTDGLRAGPTDGPGRTLWLENEAVVADVLTDPRLQALADVFRLLGGQRLETEEGGELVIFGEGFEVDAVDAVRKRLADRLVGFRIEAHGVHELAVHLFVAPAPTPVAGPAVSR